MRLADLLSHCLRSTYNESRSRRLGFFAVMTWLAACAASTPAERQCAVLTSETDETETSLEAALDELDPRVPEAALQEPDPLEMTAGGRAADEGGDEPKSAPRCEFDPSREDWGGVMMGPLRKAPDQPHDSDPSALFDWMIRASHDAARWRLDPELGRNSPLSGIYQVEPRWRPGEPQLSSCETARIEPAEVGPWVMQLLSYSGRLWEHDWWTIRERGIWLGHDAAPHRELRVAERRGDDALWLTDRGVVLRRRGEYAWLFVSDALWSDGERETEVLSGGFAGERVWFTQFRNPNWSGPTLWLVDPGNGRMVSLQLRDLEWQRRGRATTLGESELAAAEALQAVTVGRWKSGFLVEFDGSEGFATAHISDVVVAEALKARVERPTDRGVPDVETKDRDGDGADETLTMIWDAGSGHGSTWCTLDDEGRGERWEVLADNSFGTMVDLVAEPAGLPNRELRDALMECATAPRAPMHPSFRWYVDAMQRIVHSPPGLAHKTLTMPFSWQSGKPTAPTQHAHRITSDEIRPWMRDARDETARADAIWLTYFGLGHASPYRLRENEPTFRPVGRSGGKRLLATRHGLVLQRGGRHAWIFVSDSRLGGPDKLRFESVVDAGFIDPETIWMLQNNVNGGGSYSVWVIRDGWQAAFSLSSVAWSTQGEAVDDYEIARRLPTDRFSVGLESNELRLRLHTNDGELKAVVRIDALGFPGAPKAHP